MERSDATNPGFISRSAGRREDFVVFLLMGSENGMLISTTIRNVAAVAFLVGLASYGLIAADPATPSKPHDTLTKMARPEYDADGKLLRPTGFEKWVVVGTSIGLGYSDGDKKNPDNPGTFHNVYLQPEAFDHYVETGKFPEQSVFIVTNNHSQPAKTKGPVSRLGFVAAPMSGLEIAIKDSKKYPDGWAYFMFHDKPGTPAGKVRAAEREFERKDCFDCHAEHGAVDNVFTQFYSVLTDARENRLARSKAGPASE